MNIGTINRNTTVETISDINKFEYIVQSRNVSDYTIQEVLDGSNFFIKYDVDIKDSSVTITDMQKRGILKLSKLSKKSTRRTVELLVEHGFCIFVKRHAYTMKCLDDIKIKHLMSCSPIIRQLTLSSMFDVIRDNAKYKMSTRIQMKFYNMLIVSAASMSISLSDFIRMCISYSMITSEESIGDEVYQHLKHNVDTFELSLVSMLALTKTFDIQEEFIKTWVENGKDLLTEELFE